MSPPELEALRGIVARFAGRRILVLGDLMLDRYLWGRVDRISPEAPVPVVEVERESLTLGGAGNVAANLRALGAEPALVAAVGDDDDGARLLETLDARGVATRGIVRDPARPTTVKTRVIAHAQQVVRADREIRSDLAGSALAAVLARLEEALAACEGVLISDYGKGVITGATLARALGGARARGIAVSVDPKESHIDAYHGVSILTPNQHEAGYIQGRRIVDDASLNEVGRGLQQRLDAEAVLVTRGPGGMSLFERGGRTTHLPTVAREVYDVTGAGDTVVSVVALALAAGADYPTASYLSNQAAGLVIREVGTASCTPAQLLAALADGRG
ncbi:MAG: D-glycero-beta-D-manno-heptose-7-phosphate kinase [Candidatus Eisenbacteria bacterium]|uniref:D-glycero-beta-D-manno-heptose-7-phosphate kinase n=1 Tax=Eiseniibacteriota bacterium TaxID=2212470 RepID=A0A538UBD3_UNCEI|nr:MAG: D-glycero-beta-D-manno-heptose-7-phosphate kinase [Candidatus Eisenbacteria bacterium]